MALGGSVELGELLSRDPVLLVLSAAGILDLVAAEEVPPNPETSYEAATTRGVPVACDLGRLRLGEHGMEDRLIWQPRRKRSHVGLRDQLELTRTHRPPKGHHLVLHAARYHVTAR